MGFPNQPLQDRRLVAPARHELRQRTDPSGLGGQEDPKGGVDDGADEAHEGEHDENETDKRHGDTARFGQGYGNAGNLAARAVAMRVGRSSACVQRAPTMRAEVCFGPDGFGAEGAVFRLVFGHLTQ